MRISKVCGNVIAEARGDKEPLLLLEFRKVLDALNIGYGSQCNVGRDFSNTRLEYDAETLEAKMKEFRKKRLLK